MSIKTIGLPPKSIGLLVTILNDSCWWTTHDLKRNTKYTLHLLNHVYPIFWYSSIYPLIHMTRFVKGIQIEYGFN